MRLQMSPPTTISPGIKAGLLAWLPIIIGLVVLYAPSLYDLFTGIWASDDQLHGPIVLGISVWLLYRKWPQAMSQTPSKPAPVWGALVFGFGLLAYVVGRSQLIVQLEAGSVIPVVIGLVLITRGTAALRKLWFPLFFMLFMVPLPGVFVQMLTLPLKTAVSFVAEELLFVAGYPVSRTGVTLQVAQYQMLVADACAGLHTLFTLEALGLLYMNLVGHTSIKRNLTLALLIVPISFTANVIRVLALILITYYFGDAAGQGFLHGFAGMTLFISALLLILAVDNVLGKFYQPRELKHV